MKIADLLKKYSSIEIELLISHVLKKPKEYVFVYADKTITSAQAKKITALAKKRLKDHPIAYLIGHKNFFGLDFKVTKDTLIPRPESEWLVEKVLQIAKDKNKVSLLDIGTGSGCIAVSIAQSITTPHYSITASDISSKALIIAKQNAKTHHAPITFLRSDLLTKVPGTFDVIIANLPYVPVSDYKKLYQNLKYEPKSAITDGTNTFKLISKLLEQAQEKLDTDGVALLEIDPTFKTWWNNQSSIKKIWEIEFHKDLAKRWRYCILTKKD
jgi:release factor glutamine methyltransferase